jgi:hypothetical protein
MSTDQLFALRDEATDKDVISLLENRQKRLSQLLETLLILYKSEKTKYDALHTVPFASDVFEQSMMMIHTLLLPLCHLYTPSTTDIIPITPRINAVSTLDHASASSVTNVVPVVPTTHSSIHSSNEKQSIVGVSSQTSQSIDSNQSDLSSVTCPTDVIVRLNPNKLSDQKIIDILKEWQTGNTLSLMNSEKRSILKSYDQRMGDIKDYRLLYRGVSEYEPELVKLLNGKTIVSNEKMTIQYQRPTSWTFSYATAKHFALSENAVQSLGKGADAPIVGYVLVLRMTDDDIQKQVLFDIGRTRVIEKYNAVFVGEREVLLDIGSYNVILHKVSEESHLTLQSTKDSPMRSLSNQSSHSNQSDLASVACSQKFIAQLDDKKATDKRVMEILQLWQVGLVWVLRKSEEEQNILRSYPQRMGAIKDYRLLYRGVDEYEPELIKLLEDKPAVPHEKRTFHYDRLTSWTFSWETAKHFALSKISAKEMKKRVGEQIVGYVLVLRMTDDEIKKQVLFDIGRTSLAENYRGSFLDIFSRQREVIMETGSYNVVLHKVVCEYTGDK